MSDSTLPPDLPPIPPIGRPLPRATPAPPPDRASVIPSGPLPVPLGPLGDWTPRDLTTRLAAILAVVLAHTVFVAAGGRLVELVNGSLRPVTVASIWARLSCLVVFAGKGGSHRSLPREYGTMVVEHARYLFWPLRGVRYCPFVTRDGELAEEPGYYPADQLYLHYPDGARPALIHQGDARRILSLYLDDFVFRDIDSAITILAMYVEPFLLPHVDAPSPMYVVQAPDARAGKSTASRGPGIVALGRMPDPEHAARMRRRSVPVRSRAPIPMHRTEGGRLMDAANELLLILVCLGLSAFFSGSETALLRLGRHQIDADVAGTHGLPALAARNLVEHACRRDKMAFRERELAEPMPSFSLGIVVGSAMSVSSSRSGRGRVSVAASQHPWPGWRVGSKSSQSHPSRGAVAASYGPGCHHAG